MKTSRRDFLAGAAAMAAFAGLRGGNFNTKKCNIDEPIIERL